MLSCRKNILNLEKRVVDACGMYRYLLFEYFFSFLRSLFVVYSHAVILYSYVEIIIERTDHNNKKIYPCPEHSEKRPAAF
jgi:hypothetical protein